MHLSRLASIGAMLFTVVYLCPTSLSYFIHSTARGDIYTIILLNSVAVRKRQLQFLLDRLGICLKLFVSTENTSSHEFASQLGLSPSTSLSLSLSLSPSPPIYLPTSLSPPALHTLPCSLCHSCVQISPLLHSLPCLLSLR